MLRKLLKHEFRATARVMGPLYLILLATAIGANFSTRGLMESESRLANMLGGLLVVAFTVAIIGVCAMSLVLMVQRFSKNLLGDEGYVMFTLPASVHQQVWSKLLVSSVWFFCTAAAVVLASCIMAYDVGVVANFLSELKYMFQQLTAYYALNGTAIAVEILVFCFLGCVAFCLQFYAALAVGHSFANHKQALSVVFFFVFQFAVQILGSSLLIAGDFWDIFRLLPDFHVNGMTAVHLTMGLMIACMVVYGAVFYGITTFSLKKRLNLE